MDLTNLADALGERGTHRVFIRLRENQALEIQQKLLSDLGRVGLVAPMPGTFPVRIEVGFADEAGVFQRLNLATVGREGGVCFIGRDRNSKPVTRLVFSEAACDEILAAINPLESNAVHARAADTLNLLKNSTLFASALEHGIPAPAPHKGNWTPLQIEGKDAQGTAIHEIVGLIARNPPVIAFTSQELRNAGFVLVLRDVHLQEAVAAAAAETAGASEEQSADPG
jgi:hypothetical protein